jgi:hypothetical protein
VRVVSVVRSLAGQSLMGGRREECLKQAYMTTDIAKAVGMTQRRLLEPPGQPMVSCCPIECIPHSEADPI